MSGGNLPLSASLASLGNSFVQRRKLRRKFAPSPKRKASAIASLLNP